MARRSKRRRPRWLSVLLVLVVAAAVLLLRLTEEIGPERTPGDRFMVAEILDGDTMELAGGDRLRLLAVDTPEKGEPFYDEATAMLSRLTLDQSGEIQYASKRRDRYGRLLGYFYLDTLFVNKMIIDSGYGYVYLFSDNELNSDQVRTLLDAQASAIERRVGLWSIARAVEPFYINKRGSFRLHRPGCQSVRVLKPGTYQEFPNREDGIVTGLSPCRNCKP